MDLSWDHFNSSLQAKTLKNNNFACADFQEKFDTPPLKPTKSEPSFRKINSHPTTLHMVFPTHLQASELCPQTYSLSLPLEWSQGTHIPTSIKSGRAYKPEKSAFYTMTMVPLPGNFVRTPVFQDGSLPFQYTHKHSSPLRQALHTQITQPSHSTSYKICLVFSFLSVGGFLQSSAQPHESAARPLQRAAGHIKGTCPPC